jgi:hypothetical protein
VLFFVPLIEVLLFTVIAGFCKLRSCGLDLGGVSNHSATFDLVWYGQKYGAKDETKSLRKFARVELWFATRLKVFRLGEILVLSELILDGLELRLYNF